MHVLDSCPLFRPTSVFGLLALATVFGFVVLLILAIRRRYFHPLSRFPGPFWGSLTDWYLVWVIKSVPTYGLDLHKKYGPIVRLSPNLLSFSDPRYLPRVYHRAADKPQFYGSWMFGHTAAMFQSLKHEDHAAKKRLVAPCCSMTQMKLYHEHKITERVDELCVKIRERSVLPNQPLDFSEYLRYFLSDTWSHLVYGKPMGWVREGQDVGGLLAALQGVYGMSATAAVMPWLMPSLRSPTIIKYFWSRTATFKNMDLLFKQFDTMINQPRSRSDGKEDVNFFDGLNPTEKSIDFQFSREDIKAEVITFTAATLDGVAAFISPFIDNMTQYPAIRKRLMEEITAADSAGRLSRPVARYEETLDLPFFMACIKETLRHDAPAQTILPRIVSDGGYWLDDHVYIPAGTHMGASPFIIHRDQHIFGADAERFRPERWLGDECGVCSTPVQHDAHVRLMEKYGMWWGYGDRECAGKYYAVMEMQKLCVELLRRFDFCTPDSLDGRFKHERWAVGMFWNQMLQFSERCPMSERPGQTL